MSGNRSRIGILATHPIQYYVPWYRALAREAEVDVYFSHRQTAEGQARAGFGVAFDWDVPMFDGYRHTFLTNVARHPDVGTFWGCNTPGVATVIADGRFDAFIVHGWATWSYWQAMMACWRTGTPLMVRGDSTLRTPRARWWRAVKTPVFRAFIPRFDAYLVVGERARQYLQYYGAAPERCFAAPHAVDNEFFSSRAEALRAGRADLRREFGLPERGVVVLFAGRLIDMKRPDTFVDAVAALSARYPQISGLVAGDGPLRRALEDCVARRSAPIRFAGFLNQTSMTRAYAAADVFVLPSDARETWGLVVNEAMASGLPAVVSDEVGCAADLVRPGETGDVFHCGDAAGLARCLERFITDEHYLRASSDAARQHIAGWDISVAAAGTLEAVRSIQGVRGRGQAVARPGTEAVVPQRDARGLR